MKNKVVTLYQVFCNHSKLNSEDSQPDGTYCHFHQLLHVAMTEKENKETDNSSLFLFKPFHHYSFGDWTTMSM